ncbi:biotin-dependent carboxyltransferase family protein [Winogradskyella flava]|uniref:Biotin-dependent carboxyltransferase family protein n=1 Tax=Winogradskyella flava TaxID=1884876 RepID=A0A842IR75_9FLAO|nr:biotin-dependent carboxyltransferase family protein [Winogradskyella flava]MBC2845351.1 biotin-dependent carboxyltransferase family protein [Winogradskyella flava]
MLKVLNPGFYTTIQDAGRFGFREYGVPVSGVMDSYSSQFANALLGNSDDAAVLEMTMIGGSFQFYTPILIAISGAIMSPKLNDEHVRQHTIIQIRANDILSFGRATNGFRTYLAVKGGLKSDNTLGSQSQYTPITKANVIFKDDILEYSKYSDSFKKVNASVKFNDSVFKSNILEAYKGPEFDQFSESQKQLLLSDEFEVSKLNNRMAYQLEPLLTNSLKPILTSPVLPGTVQLTPSGQLIVLMRDCQTTGGYPRILQLTEKAINRLSQRTTQSCVKFRLKV